MSVSIFATAQVLAATHTNTAVNNPAGTQAGDYGVLLLDVGSAVAVNATPPTGWTNPDGSSSQPYQSVTDGSTFTRRVFRFVRVYDGTEGTGALTTGHTSCSSSIQLFVFRGESQSAPLNPAATVQNGSAPGSTVTLTAPGLNAVAGSALIMVAMNWDGIQGVTPPAGFTEYYNDGLSDSLWVGAVANVVGGATGDKTITTTAGAAGTPWSAGLIAIQPPVTSVGASSMLLGVGI